MPVLVCRDIVDLAPVAALTIAGHIDEATIGREIVLRGWGRLSAEPAGKLIRLHTDLPVASVSAVSEERPDVVAAVKDAGLAFSGFVVTIALRGDADLPDEFTLCMATEDAVYGSFRMHDTPKVPCSLPVSEYWR